MESPLRDRIPTGTQLIETFALYPGEKVARWELHVARLTRSAQTLGFAFDQAKVVAALDKIDADEARRCRLTLSMDGEIAISTADLPPTKDAWKASISPVRLSSDDDFLRHKSTRRALYDTVRVDMPSGIDEVIFLNERDEVCEGTITNILVQTRDGNWLTPPISCGCLPGVYRQSLLNSGHIREAFLTLEDLRSANEIRLCNALRGEISASLIE